jgi:hypothetical protein
MFEPWNPSEGMLLVVLEAASDLEWAEEERLAAMF